VVSIVTRSRLEGFTAPVGGTDRSGVIREVVLAPPRDVIVSL